MTTNISGHRSWQKINPRGIKIDRKTYSALAWKIISNSNIIEPIRNTEHVKILYLDLYKDFHPFTINEHELFLCMGCSPSTDFLYMYTDHDRFQQFLQSLDGPALAEYAILRMQRG